uniref:uncharacterized protein LOC105353315 n=1 Tax=Fragaria vesca subsp. vesca TaxID=101020 RepID=UPI0005C81F83|nr:PREDICTED: uncharacterized protein LOC105353315 [Fragaria vesca subsp. vesca]
MASSSSSGDLRAPMFVGDNYDFWSIKMKTVLKSYDIWYLVEDGFDNPASTEGLTDAQKVELRSNMKKDAKALAIIQQAVTDEIFPNIANEESSKSAWDVLAEEYRGTKEVRAVKVQSLRRDFEYTRMKDGEALDDYLTRLTNIVNQMKTYGEPLEDKRVVQKILISLSEKFDAVVSVIDLTKDIETLRVQKVIGCLKAYDQRLNKRAENEMESAFQTLSLSSKNSGQASSSQGKSNAPKKNWKGKNKKWEKKSSNEERGSSTKDCNRNKHQAHFTEEQDDDDDGNMFFACQAATIAKDESIWFVDSGCSNHMTANESILMDMDTSVSRRVKMSNGQLAQARGRGTLYLSKLKSIDLSYSINLTRTPDFTGIPSLERLVLVGCTKLVKIHPSIALLKRLKIWNFRDCKSIKSLPSEVHMEFLEKFDVSGCSKLKMIPEFLGKTKLSKLCLGGSAVEKLPSSSEHLNTSLMELDLNGIVTSEQPYSLFLRLQNLMVSSFGFFPRKSPQLASLKHYSCLRELNLNDCNLYEGDIPNDFGSLSSLEFLELRGNNFVSLPASMHLLSKLSYINVRECKRLQQLPELPVNHHLHVEADNCTSLQVFPGPSDLCPSAFSLINCLSTVANQDASYFLYSALKRLLEVTPHFNHLRLAIPGSEIPVWFSNQSVGDSVTEKFPLDASNSKLIGFAACALIVPQENPSARPDLFSFNWYNYSTGTLLGGFSFFIYPGFSDHLMLAILPKCRLKDTCNEVKFVFEIISLGNNREVKQCGSRALYEHEMEEVISRMNQSKCNISLYEATDEQEGAMVKATQKATTSRSSGSDDEYYSAEE